MSGGELRPVGSGAIYPSLRGRKVIVSGGGSGIGEGIVEGFVRQGAAVAFVDLQQDPSEALVERLTGSAFAPVFAQCDITDITDYGARIGQLIEKLGGCDVLVNNAANDDRHKVGEITPEYWDERMAVNLKHQFFAAKAVVPAMRSAGGGSIINLGSISWHLGLEDLTIYQTAKAAIEGLTRSLARELGRDNIRVNTIVPGNVQTPRQMKWYTPEGEAEIVAAQCLDGRLQPADIAAMAMFLASDDARYCTAHNYWVDAGWR
ncbi:NAD(P)-dependent dehydrogenase (short-subunit alcohol dehydrogenase family) [Altererythrobacter atlanticus]|uniref:(S)-1-Phenylethanol dehydrogenase n=1 Tax=Croceibacterium atlanticum TaxID=1267766 RepID=A0A0F7KS13_9SPHN|nr:SDR family oxidoreductase [Croceibacterium atlanticum]AKH43248.1 (S)-1-Phenylethanol dehydrogenase [Croceibacterium atlanticum]MBB5732046.1 NAD(P)-dependent dehydrogenase (short-subunit alcohol dehydrogenase family) [Croceibacterium atlanticum]